MSAARDLGEVLAELVAKVQARDQVIDELHAKVKALEARATSAPTRWGPASDPTGAVRQAKRYAKRKAIAAAAGIPVRAVRTVSTVSTREHGLYDLNARNAVASKLLKSKKHALPSLADVDAARERCRFWKGYPEIVLRETGVQYPHWAPFPDQRALKALQREGFSMTELLGHARAMCRNWHPTEERHFPTVTLLRLQLIKQDHEKERHALEATREVPRPRIWPGHRRTEREEAQKALGRIAEELSRRGAP